MSRAINQTISIKRDKRPQHHGHHLTTGLIGSTDRILSTSKPPQPMLKSHQQTDLDKVKTPLRPSNPHNPPLAKHPRHKGSSPPNPGPNHPLDSPSQQRCQHPRRKASRIHLLPAISPPTKSRPVSHPRDRGHDPPHQLAHPTWLMRRIVASITRKGYWS